MKKQKFLNLLLALTILLTSILTPLSQVQAAENDASVIVEEERQVETRAQRIARLRDIFLKARELKAEQAWTSEDFTYSYMNYKPVMQGQRPVFAISGFSQAGLAKLDTNKELYIPKTVSIEENGQMIEKNVHGVDKNAFANLNIEKVVFPETIGEYDFVINTSAFRNSGIKSVEFKEGLKAIREGAFTYNNISELYIPSTVLTIGNESFAHNKISKLEFSDGVNQIQIDNYSFFDNQLTEVHLPYSIFKFLMYVFKGNPGMETLPPEELDARDPEGTGVVYLYTRNPDHLTAGSYIAFSKYHDIIDVSDGVVRKDLEATLREAEALNLSDYPEELSKSISTALEEARRVFSDQDSDQVAIDQANAGLSQVLDRLLSSGHNKNQLRALVEKAQGFNLDIYQEESARALQTAINQANEVLERISEGKEILEVTANLQASIEGLVLDSELTYVPEDFLYDRNAITGFSESGLAKRESNLHLVLPDIGPDGTTIEVIGPAAFEGQSPAWGTDTATPINGLESVVFPANLKRIENDAFKYNALTELNLPETLESIGNLAFNGNMIETLYLPDSLTTLGDGAFSLNQIVDLRLSPNLTEIENGAFSRNLDLKNVYLHEGITRIGQSAFIGVPIEEIVFPSTLVEIGRLAFSSSRLKSVHIPAKVEIIKDSAFKQNIKFRTLRELTFEEDSVIQTIEANAFKDGMLKEVNIPYSLENLGKKAFEGNIDYNRNPVEVKLYTTNPDHLQLSVPGQYKFILLGE